MIKSGEFVSPFSKRDDEVWEKPKRCAECGKQITLEQSFWAHKGVYYHANCVRYGCWFSPFIEDGEDKGRL